jgi:hypothetical protein
MVDLVLAYTAGLVADDNPYGDIPLGNSSQAELPNDDSSNDLESDPTPPTTQSDDIPASPPSVELELEEEAISPQAPSSVSTPRPSPPPSPNAFGTFIAGAEHGDRTLSFRERLTWKPAVCERMGLTMGKVRRR